MDEATVQILLRAKQEGIEAIRDMKDRLADLARQAEITNAQLSFIGAAAFVSSTALSALADSSNRNTGNLQVLSAATSQAAQSTFTWGTVLWPVVITLGILAGLLAAPFIPLVVAATVVTAAFAAGVTAVSLALFAAFGPLAALTAGVILLADRMFTTGQTAIDPLLKLEQALGKVADTWGKQATPMANAFLAALMPMVPLIQQIGTQALTWFGANLPMVIQITQFAAKALFDAMELGGRIFNTFFQAMATNRSTFEQFFGLLLTVGLQAVNGLLTNLLALSDWFLVRLPAMAPIVQATMGAIGSFIQGTAKVFGDVVDFFIKNWGSIASAAQQAWDKIKAGWEMVRPLLASDAKMVIETFNGLMADANSHAEALRGTMFALGFVLGLLAVAVMGAATILMGLADTLIIAISYIQSFATWVHNAWNWVTNLAGAVGNLSNAIGGIPFLGGLSSLGGGGQGGGAVGGGGGGFAMGGTVPGPVGAPQMILAHGGETVTPVGGSTDLQDTNDLLAAIHARLASIDGKLSGGFSTSAYAARA